MADMSFSKTLRNPLERGAEASVEHIELAVFCGLEILELDFLIMTELMEYWTNINQVAALNHWRQSRCS